MAVIAAFSSLGCTFFACSGGGPLRYEELGDWAGISSDVRPDPQVVQDLGDRTSWPLFTTFKAGTAGLLSLQLPGYIANHPFTPAPGMEIRGRFLGWRRLMPSKRHGTYLFRAERHGYMGASREAAASEDEWGAGMIIGDFLVAGDAANAYDLSTGQRIAAEKKLYVLGYGLGYNRMRKVIPLDKSGEPGIHAIVVQGAGPSSLRYEIKDGTSLLFGILGWGRVNRKRYIQILWIPIPVGTAKL